MTTNDEIRVELKKLVKGRYTIAYGRNVKHVCDLIRSAKRGTGKHFMCKTTDTGVSIQRVE